MPVTSEKRNHAPYLYLTRSADLVFDLYVLIPATAGKKVVFPEVPQFNPSSVLFTVFIQADDTALRATDFAFSRQLLPIEDAGCPAARIGAFELIVEVRDETGALTARSSMFCEDADEGPAEWANDQVAYNSPYLFLSKPLDAQGRVLDSGEMRYLLPLKDFALHSTAEEAVEGEVIRHIFLVKTETPAALVASNSEFLMMEDPNPRTTDGEGQLGSVKSAVTGSLSGANTNLVLTDVADTAEQTPVQSHAVEVYLADTEEDAVQVRVLLGRENPEEGEASVLERALGPGKRKYKGRSKNKPSNSR
jgi:hypothetical protein